MKRIIFTLSLFLSIHLMLSAQIDEQFITRFKQFGNAVAIDGDWAIVGNMYEGRIENGGIEYPIAGAAYIFHKQANGLWTQHSFLTEKCWFDETNEQHGVHYGMSVDIYGDWAVVGADYDSDETSASGPDGVVFVYKYRDTNDSWDYYATLDATDKPGQQHSPLNNFGFSVSVSEGFLAVGDPDWGDTDGDLPFRGAVYVYRNPDGFGWQFEEQILAYDGWAFNNITGGYGDNFGYDVATFSNDKIVVGAPNKGREFGYTNYLGKVYVYKKDPVDGWQVDAELYDPINWPDAGVRNVGYSVDINDQLVIVGAPGSSSQTGKLFAMTDFGGGNWTTVALNTEASWVDNDRFGHDVSIAKNSLNTYTFLVGAPGDDGENYNLPNQGLVVMYETGLPVIADNLVPVPVLSENMTAGIEYGQSVAIDDLGANCVIGAWRFDEVPGGSLEGAVVFFSFAEAFEGIWQGTIDTDWTKPGNWSDNNVPNGNTNVTIADDAPNMPVLSTLGFCSDLDLDLNETLTLNGYDAELRVNRDATILGEFIIPEGENNDLARLDVYGDFYIFCEKDKQLPAGGYYGDLKVDATNSPNDLSQAGDVFVFGKLFIQNKGELKIGAHYLELHDLMSIASSGKLSSTNESDLAFAGEPVMPESLPSSIYYLKNLTINNGQGIGSIKSGDLSIYGTLNLVSGEFKVIGNYSGPGTLTLYNSVAGNGNLFTYINSRIDVKGAVENFELPSILGELGQLNILNPNNVILKSDIFITSTLGLFSGDIDNNGYQVGFGPSGEYLAVSDVVIKDDLFDPANPPASISVWSGGSVLVDGVVEVKDLTVEGAAGALTINPIKGLTVTNTINVSGSFLLKSSLAGNASFIDNTNGTTAIQATLETYLSAGRWHYVSPSVEESTAAAYFVENGSDIWMKTFNEASNQWEYINSLSYPLAPGKGYAVWVDGNRSDEIASYDGVLNKGDQLLNLSYSGENHGWNLIGNPFPSSLEWNGVSWNPQNTTGVVVVYDNGNYVYSNLDGNGTLANNIIPPGQGFFVQAVAANASIKLPQENRVHSIQPFYKQTQTYTDALIASISSAGKRDKTWISFSEEASDEFEMGRDAYRLQGDAGMPKLYTRFGDQKLALNVMGQLVGQKSVPLYFEPAQDGVFQLEFSYLDSFTDTEIWLEDHATGEMISLNENSLYSFEAFAGADPHRFSLHFNRTATSLESVLLPASAIKVYSANGKLVVEANQKFDEAVLTIHSVNGQLLYQQNFSGKKPLIIDANHWLNQLVIVRVLNNVVQENYKVFIK